MQQQNATKEVAYRVNSMLQLLDIFQSTILNEELSINNIISYKKIQTHSQKHLISNKNSEYTEKQKNLLTIFIFQHSQLTQKEFEKLADLLLGCPTVYATSEFDVGKLNSPLHLPLKPDAVFKKQRATNVPILLHDKVNRLLDILEQNEIISPVN